MRPMISLPKNIYENLLRKAELVERVRVLLQEEYPFEEFEPTRVQKNALLRARRNKGKGNTLTLNELRNCLKRDNALLFHPICSARRIRGDKKI